jgi:hypothetical protein
MRTFEAGLQNFPDKMPSLCAELNDSATALDANLKAI